MAEKKKEKATPPPDGTATVEKKVIFTQAEWLALWRRHGGRKGTSVSNLLRRMAGLHPLKWGGQNKGKRRGEK